MKRLVVIGLALVPVAAPADQIVLRSGGRIAGRVVERSQQTVTIETGPGRVTLPLSFVDRIVEGTSPIQEYRERSLRLAAGDIAGWLDLGWWASERGLSTQAGEAFRRVVALDPANAAAQQALGNLLVGDRWVSPEESYRARGYVLFEGQWITSQERDAIRDARRLRNEEIAAARSVAEADSRIREAEARVREAEARARAAEADAQRASDSSNGSSGGYYPGGIPYVPAQFPPCPYPDGCSSSGWPNLTGSRSSGHHARPPHGQAGSVRPQVESPLPSSWTPVPRPTPVPPRLTSPEKR